MFVHSALLAACCIDNACRFTLEGNDPFVRKAFTDTITSLELEFGVSTIIVQSDVPRYAAARSNMLSECVYAM